ncbi:MAG: hypothetical protein KatS3mg131_0109 [Candidatus Tectimicrobiota bacterium]|nr:MAG: hypothetical protein KatS3mg131_0109 [Candidatus Tectomicrobia bacterium]
MAAIRQVKQGLATVLSVQAPLTGELADQLREQILHCLAAGEVHLILDCQHVPYLDSRALETLLFCSRQARRQGGGLKLIHLGDVCQDILVATRLDKLLECYPDMAGALGSYL